MSESAAVPAGAGRPTRPTRPRGPDLVIVAALVANAVYGLILLPIAPSLIGTHPLLLEWLSASSSAEITVGALVRVGSVPLVVALIAAVPSSMVVDWAYWWAGRRWGDQGLHLLLERVSGRTSTPRTRARIARVERLVARWGPASVILAYYLPVPNVLVYAAAGLGGMRLRVFLLLDLVGTLLWIGLIVGLGYAIGQRAIDLSRQISHYGLYLSLAILAAIVIAQVLRRRAGPAQA